MSGTMLDRSNIPCKDKCPVFTYLHLALREKNRTPSPSDILMSWARPLLASIAIALRNSVFGILESGDGTGGSVIS